MTDESLRSTAHIEAGAEIYGKDGLSWEKEVARTFEVIPPW